MGGGVVSRITNQLLLKMQETAKVAKSFFFLGGDNIVSYCSCRKLLEGVHILPESMLKLNL